MALHKLERKNYGRKLPLSSKYQNPHSFKEGLILLCQSIFETRRITHLQGSAHFTIPLNMLIFKMNFGVNMLIGFKLIRRVQSKTCLFTHHMLTYSIGKTFTSFIVQIFLIFLVIWFLQWKIYVILRGNSVQWKHVFQSILSPLLVKQWDKQGFIF